MERSELTSQDFLIWWRNRFPKLTCIFAPYIRTQISRSLGAESCFTLRISYFVAHLSEDDPDEFTPASQFDWLSPDSREGLIDDLVVLGMDALVKHMRDNPYAGIPAYISSAVTDRLNLKLDDYFSTHRATLIEDMESATGQTTDQLPKKLSLSTVACDADQYLTLPYVQKFLKYIERADHELVSLKELLLTPDDSVDPLVKRRYLDFRIELNRHLNSFEGQIPEIAEEWIYNTLELMEAYPNYFGK